MLKCAIGTSLPLEEPGYEARVSNSSFHRYSHNSTCLFKHLMTSRTVRSFFVIAQRDGNISWYLRSICKSWSSFLTAWSNKNAEMVLLFLLKSLGTRLGYQIPLFTGSHKVLPQHTQGFPTQSGRTCVGLNIVIHFHGDHFQQELAAIQPPNCFTQIYMYTHLHWDHFQKAVMSMP